MASFLLPSLDRVSQDHRCFWHDNQKVWLRWSKNHLSLFEIVKILDHNLATLCSFHSRLALLGRHWIIGGRPRKVARPRNLGVTTKAGSRSFYTSDSINFGCRIVFCKGNDKSVVKTENWHRLPVYRVHSSSHFKASECKTRPWGFVNQIIHCTGDRGRAADTSAKWVVSGVSRRLRNEKYWAWIYAWPIGLEDSCPRQLWSSAMNSFQPFLILDFYNCWYLEGREGCFTFETGYMLPIGYKVTYSKSYIYVIQEYMPASC